MHYRFWGLLDSCLAAGVSVEAIETLFAGPVAILHGDGHSEKEQRFRAIGWANKNRAIFVVFTLRHRGDAVLIRPISARYMHKKEIKTYEKENPDLQ
jgi:uncharacterized DUF497 family protein